MFNQAGFNLMPFDRELSYELFLSFNSTHKLEEMFAATVHFNESFDLQHTLDTDLYLVKDKFVSFVENLVLSMNFVNLRERTFKINLQHRLDTDFHASKSQIAKLVFTGNFEPGDKIVIDSKRLKLTKNNLNALNEMQGEFLNLYVGDNEIRWNDGEEEREILIRLQHDDKFV